MNNETLTAPRAAPNVRQLGTKRFQDNVANMREIRLGRGLRWDAFVMRPLLREWYCAADKQSEDR